MNSGREAKVVSRPFYFFKSNSLPPATSGWGNQTDDHQKHHATDEGDDAEVQPWVTEIDGNMQGTNNVIADERADQTDDDIADDPEARTARHETRQPAGNRTNDQQNKYGFT